MVKAIKNLRSKAVMAVFNAKMKSPELSKRTANVLFDKSGQGALDVAIVVLISIVLGSLILAGLYLIINGTVLPSVVERIKNMFDYKG